MAVDYDGSKTAFDSSANYTAQEFANDVIYTIKQVCDDENVPHPTIIQESGRFLAAYHAILVTNVLDEIETVVEDITPIEIDEDDPQVVSNSAICRESITVKNYREYYRRARTSRRVVHAVQSRIDLARGSRERRSALLDVCERADKYAQQAKYVSEEFSELRRCCAKIPDELLGVSLSAGPLGARSTVSDRADSSSEQAAN